MSYNLFDLTMYLSNWSLLLFIFWLVSDKLKKYLHLEVLVQFVYYGFLLLYFYYLFLKKYTFSFSLVIINFIIHYIPYKVISKNPISNQSYYFFFLVSIVYLVYLSIHKKNVIQVYFTDIKKYLM